MNETLRIDGQTITANLPPTVYRFIQQVELTDECIQKIAERVVELIKDAKINEDKQGEWFFEEYPDGYYHSECSKCGAQYGEEAFLEKWNYCPNCGVRMNGENKND